MSDDDFKKQKSEFYSSLNSSNDIKNEFNYKKSTSLMMSYVFTGLFFYGLVTSYDGLNNYWLI